MINAIIPGFAVSLELFEDFLSVCPPSIFISNNSNTYEEIESKLLELTKSGIKLNLFGWSLGSLFALKWAIKNHEKISSLFLTGATARFCEKEGYKNGVTIKKLEQMKRLLNIKSMAVMNDFYNSILDMTEDKKKYLSILLKNMPGEQSLTNGLNELMVIDLLDQVHKIKKPLYILQGEKDKITPLAGAKILNSLVKNSILKIFDGGHSIFLEDMIYCSNTWKDFLCSIN